MSNQKRSKDLFIGAVVGGVLGAATALLFAPKSGRELRSGISEQAQSITAKTQQVAETVSHKTQEIAKTVGSHSAEWYEKAKDTAATVVDNVRSWKETRKGELPDQEPEASEAAEDLVIIGNR